MKQKEKLVLDAAIYYIPIYCYRHTPTTDDIYQYIINCLTGGLIRRKSRKIKLYTTVEAALKEAASMKCDDDCYTAAAIDFTCGYAECYLIREEHDRIRPGLSRWSDVYEIVE